MAQIQLIKITADSLAPANAEAREYLARVKTGVWLNCEIRQQRNYQFHKNSFHSYNSVSNIGRRPVVRSLLLKNPT